MKTITMIGCFAFSQMMAFSQNMAESTQAQLVRMLPAGNYQLRTAAVKTDHEDIDPLITQNVTVRHDKNHVFLDIGDLSVPVLSESRFALTFILLPSNKPQMWQGRLLEKHGLSLVVR